MTVLPAIFSLQVSSVAADGASPAIISNVRRLR